MITHLPAALGDSARLEEGLCPALRTGYLVLPPGMIREGRSRKWFCDLHNETPTQLALAAFIRQGHYLRHLGRMKRQYAQKRRLTETALRSALGPQVQILGTAAGLHLTARFKGIRFTPALLERIEAAGVRVYPAETHAIVRGRLEDALIIGYGNREEDEIREGIARLGSVLGADAGAGLPGERGGSAGRSSGLRRISR